MKRNRLKSAYKALCLVFANTVVAFLFLNLGAWAISDLPHLFRSPESETDPLSAQHGDVLGVVYPDKNRNEVARMLQETWSRPYVYEPFTQFKEAPYSGQYVNVHESGFRRSRNQGPWPPDPSKFNIFLFGGSTVFNYGVSDKETIASALSTLLSEGRAAPVPVYNFGRGHYYSTQERVLFEALLASDAVPDLAIFIDGLNEFFHTDNRPELTDLLATFVRDGRGPVPPQPSLWQYLRGLPLPRLLVNSFPGATSSVLSSSDARSTAFQEADDMTIGRVIENYFANKSLIEAAAASRQIPAVFVWQPVPTYLFEGDSYPYNLHDLGPHNNSRRGYRLMADRIAVEEAGPNFFWCADFQQGLEGPLYIDQIHYSARMSDYLAREIVGHLSRSGILDGFEQ